MFFISKKRFEEKLISKAKKEEEKKSIGARSLIEDIQDRSGSYVSRLLQVSFEEMYLMYLRNEWVRACVDKLTKSVTNSKLYAGPIDETNVSQETKNHIEEINKLLDDPNVGLNSWNDIRKEYLRDILVYDAGAIEIVYDTSGLPAELYSLKGDRIRLNVDEHGNFNKEESAFIQIGGYFGSKKVNDIPFATNEVIYLVANPKSGSVYGLSPLETLYQSVASDLYATKHNSSFFKNNAEASGIIGVEGINESDLARFRAYWKREIQGKPHKIAMVNGKVSWTSMSMTNRDMEFLDYQRWLLCKIMAVYGMQPVILGIIDPTTGKLNSAEQIESYKEEAVKPLLQLECYQLTKILVQRGFGYTDVKINYEAIDLKDEMQEVDKAVKLKKEKIITTNEARRMYLDLDEIDEDKLNEEPEEKKPREKEPEPELESNQEELKEKKPEEKK